MQEDPTRAPEVMPDSGSKMRLQPTRRAAAAETDVAVDGVVAAGKELLPS